MTPRFPLMLVALSLAQLACGGDGTGPDNTPLCEEPTPLALGVGEHQIVDPLLETSCLSLPGGDAVREYLVVPYAGRGEQTGNGVSATFQLRTDRDNALPELTAARVAPTALAPQDGAEAFHLGLRRAEAALARSPVAALSRAAPSPALRAPPTVGQVEQFRVCRSNTCTTTVSVDATARYVGTHGAIYLDNEMPAGAQALTPEDIAHLGALFDEHLHPIDTAAFGANSDIDGDGLVAIVITDQVNDLSPDCTNGRVVGYFFGGDLLVSHPGSNRREVFFAFAPKPATGTCPAVTRLTALRSLPPVLIHELQHMISFNQRVLLRGRSDEATWLNEGLSHYAEELGQRLIPDAMCPASSSCFAQFASGNVQNAYLYLEDPEGEFLVAPGDDGPTIAGRGAGWLFVRWLADHFATDQPLGRQLTRALLTGSGTGAGNVSTVTGVPFARLAGEWLLANYLENLPGVPQAGRLHYSSWDLRATYLANHPAQFARPYPLIPDSTDGHSVHGGTLRGGSGYHRRVVVPPGVPGVTVRLTDQSGALRISSAIEPRIAVVRIR